MNKKNRMFSTMFAATAFWAGTAGAVNLDFIGHIDNVSGERAVEPDLNAFSSLPYVSIPTTALGYTVDSNGKIDDSAYAYFDKGSAGIGVCKAITATKQCTNPADDNLEANEILGLSWGSSYWLESLSFRGELHPTDPEFDSFDVFNYSLDGGASWLEKNLKNAKFGVVEFGIMLNPDQQILLAFNNEQYYVSAAVLNPVPEPGTLALLGLGLVGMGLSRRRKAP